MNEPWPCSTENPLLSFTPFTFPPFFYKETIKAEVRIGEVTVGSPLPHGINHSQLIYNLTPLLLIIVGVRNQSFPVYSPSCHPLT